MSAMARPLRPHLLGTGRLEFGETYATEAEAQAAMDRSVPTLAEFYPGSTWEHGPEVKRGPVTDYRRTDEPKWGWYGVLRLPTQTRYTVEQVRAMEFPLHRVEWTISDDYGPRARLLCTALPGSKCRLECAERCGAEQWPCRSWDDAKDDWGGYHDMVDSGHCGVLAYWDDGTAAEVYDQDAGEAQVRSGPISLRWDGDNYLWRYAEPAEIREPYPPEFYAAIDAQDFERALAIRERHRRQA